MKVMIVSLEAYGPLMDDPHFTYGGSGLQLSLLAKEIADRNIRVTIITTKYSYKKCRIKLNNNLEILCVRTSPIKYFRRIYPYYFDLFKYLLTEEYDIIITKGADFLIPLFGLISWSKKSKFVFWLSSDSEIYFSHFRKSIISWFLYRIGMNFADRVVAQTDCQKSALRRIWRLDSTVIYNSCRAQVLGDITPSVIYKANYFIWIGRLTKEKRPEVLIQLAERNPDINFVLVDGTGETFPNTHVKNTIERVKQIRNIKYFVKLRYMHLASLLTNALALINTSEFEGFPNSLLDAWLLGTPVITFGVNPDNLLTNHNLGCVASDFQELDRLVKKIWHGERTFDRMHIKKFCYNKFSIKKNTDALMKIMQELHEQSS